MGAVALWEVCGSYSLQSYEFCSTREEDPGLLTQTPAVAVRGVWLQQTVQSWKILCPQ